MPLASLITFSMSPLQILTPPSCSQPYSYHHTPRNSKNPREINSFLVLVSKKYHKMSIVVALFMAFLFLPMHACNARHTFRFVSYDEDVEKEKLEEMGVKALSTSEGTKETILGGKTIISMDMDGTQVTTEVHGLKKTNARSMLESGSKEEVKNPAAAAARANEDENEAMEDVGFMDYVQAHRKSPIHNHH